MKRVEHNLKTLKCIEASFEITCDPYWVIMYHVFVYVGIVRFVERLQESKRFMIVQIDLERSSNEDPELSPKSTIVEQMKTAALGVLSIVKRTNNNSSRNSDILHVVPKYSSKSGIYNLLSDLYSLFILFLMS